MKKTVLNPVKNIALKVPADEFKKSVAFYRDVIGLTVLKTTAQGSVVFEFGGKKLWVDRRPALSQAEIWLVGAFRDRHCRCGKAPGQARSCAAR